MNALGALRGGLLVVASAAAFLTPAYGANIKIQCGGRAHQTINGVLRFLDPAESNTITVNGNCHENVVVQSFDRLTLVTTTGATINDASGGIDAVLDIEDSRSVTLQGFTINGGGGVLCGGASVCRLIGNTIQSSTANGIAVIRASTAFLANNVVQNNALPGLGVNGDSRVISNGDSFVGNTDSGARVLASYFLCTGSTIQNNGSNGSAGVVGLEGARVRFQSCTISGNPSSGVVLVQGAEGRFATGNIITGNGGNGVSLGDLAFASFDPGNSVTGNTGGPDVLCTPQFSATRGALANIAGGTTNCVEP